MNNSIKDKNLEEVRIQIKRSEERKNILIKNIFKQYEIYFQNIRNSLYSSVEKGIYALYSDISINDKVLDSKKLINFLNEKISLAIQSKLPFITIEQLRLADNLYSQEELKNVSALEELKEFKEYQTNIFDYADDLFNRETFEFQCNYNLDKNKYYEFTSKDDLSSVNLDEGGYLKYISTPKNIKKHKSEKQFFGSLLELIEEKNNSNFNEYEILNEELSDNLISSYNLNIFEYIDKSFSNLLLNLSYNINLELFKVNLIKKVVSEETFKFLSSQNYFIKHPYPFIINYDLNPNNLIVDNKKSSDIFLFNISYVELEFYNLDLSMCRANINELRNQFKLLNKKQRYWKKKEASLNNFY